LQKTRNNENRFNFIQRNVGVDADFPTPEEQALINNIEVEIV